VGLTDVDIKKIVAEMERLFRERTAALRAPGASFDPTYAAPDWRVGRSEMVSWANEHGIRLDLVSSADPALVEAIKVFWRRMKREFPDEGWSKAKP
jgi:hypothetical protein